jgi:hypothetical protein
MPKVAASKVCKLRTWAESMGGDTLTTDGKILFCKTCDKVGAHQYQLILD